MSLWASLILSAALEVGAGSAHAEPALAEQTRSDFDTRLSEATRGFSGLLSLYVRDLQTDDELALDADRITYLSSTIKVPVALAVFRQVDEGGLTLDQEVTFGPEDVRDGVGPLRNKSPGLRFTVLELLQLMLERSENAAADMLMKLVGVDAVNAELAARGLQFGPLITLLDERRRIYGWLDPAGEGLSPHEIHDLGRVNDLDARAELFSSMVGHEPPWRGNDLLAAFDAYYAEHFNSASMRQVGLLLTQLARCEGLSESSCKQLLALMRACHTGSHRIRAGIPSTAPWAHKTGTQYGHACDIGVLDVADDHRVVIAACVEDFEDLGQAEEVLAKIGEAVWTTLGGPPSR